VVVKPCTAEAYVASLLRLLTVSSCRHLSDLCRVGSNLILVPFSFYSVLFSSILAHKGPSRRDFVTNIISYASNCVPGKFTTKFSPTHSSGTTHHTRSAQKNALFSSTSKLNHIHNNGQYLGRRLTQRYSSVNIFQEHLLPGAGNRQLP
jgi:hypothetical protein